MVLVETVVVGLDNGVVQGGAGDRDPADQVLVLGVQFAEGRVHVLGEGDVRVFLLNSGQVFGTLAFGEKGGGLVELTGVQAGLCVVVAEDGDTRHNRKGGQRDHDVADDAQGSAGFLRLFVCGVEFGVAGVRVKVGDGRRGTQRGLLFVDDRSVGGRRIAQGLFEGHVRLVGLPGLDDFVCFFRGGFLGSLGFLLRLFGFFGGELLSFLRLFGSGLFGSFRFLRGALRLFGGSLLSGFRFLRDQRQRRLWRLRFLRREHRSRPWPRGLLLRLRPRRPERARRTRSPLRQRKRLCEA